MARIANAVSELGRLDGIVNNAGIAPPPPIEEVTAECIEKLYSIWCYAPNLGP